MQQFIVHSVIYAIGAETVTIVVRPVGGMFAGSLYDLHTTQTALAGRSPQGIPWSDSEVVAEASVLLERLGSELA